MFCDYAEISVVVSTTEGLVVPTLCDCENMNLAMIEKNIAFLSKRARGGEPTLEEMQGGTLTICNGGAF